jgi:hypothetical protein
MVQSICTTMELVSSVNTTGQHSEGTRTKFRNNRVPNHKVPSNKVTKVAKLLIYIALYFSVISWMTFLNLSRGIFGQILIAMCVCVGGGANINKHNDDMSCTAPRISLG